MAEVKVEEGRCLVARLEGDGNATVRWSIGRVLAHRARLQEEFSASCLPRIRAEWHLSFTRDTARRLAEHMRSCRYPEDLLLNLN